METKKIKVDAWLKNNTDWYYPIKEVDLNQYDYIELLSTSYEADLFYAWNEGDKIYGKLFRGRWNEGVR